MPGRSAERRDQRVVVSVHEQVEIAAYVTADQRGGGVLAAMREVRDVGLGYAAACHDRPRCSACPPGARVQHAIGTAPPAVPGTNLAGQAHGPTARPLLAAAWADPPIFAR